MCRGGDGQRRGLCAQGAATSCRRAAGRGRGQTSAPQHKRFWGPAHCVGPHASTSHASTWHGSPWRRCCGPTGSPTGSSEVYAARRATAAASERGLMSSSSSSMPPCPCCPAAGAAAGAAARCAAASSSASAELGCSASSTPPVAGLASTPWGGRSDSCRQAGGHADGRSSGHGGESARQAGGNCQARVRRIRWESRSSGAAWRCPGRHRHLLHAAAGRGLGGGQHDSRDGREEWGGAWQLCRARLHALQGPQQTPTHLE